MLDVLIAQSCFKEDAPQELVKPALSKSSTKAAALHNKTESPLLRLPAELRNTIWEDVLSFTTIHIYSDSWKGPKSSVCRSRFNDHTYGTAPDRTPADHPRAPQHRHGSYRGQHHFTCRLDTAAVPSAPSPPNLSLLHTCSATHAETALLPFALNTFSFHHDASLPPFVRRLSVLVQVPSGGAAAACVCGMVLGLERGELRTAGGGRMLFEPVRRLGLEAFSLNVVVVAGPWLVCPGLAWNQARFREMGRVVLGKWVGVGWEMGEEGEGAPEMDSRFGVGGATVWVGEEAARLAPPVGFMVRGSTGAVGEWRRSRRARMPAL